MRLRRSTAAGSPDAPPTLIGVDDLKTPWWAQAAETVASSGTGRMLRRAPVALAVIVRLAWQMSPRLTLLAAAVQLASGCTTAFGLLATANVLTRLLEQGPTPQRVLAALPALLVVMASYAVRGVLDAAVGAVEAVLTPRVELRAKNELHAAVVGAGLLNPVLAPVVLLAAAPNGWASMRAAMLSYESFVRMISRTRRMNIVGDLMTNRREAAEVRAFTTQDTLLAEHRRIGTQLTAQAVSVEHRKTVIRLIGRALAGIGTAGAYAVLGVLLYAGVMPLALAGAAAVAMRTASTAVSTTVFAAN